MEKILSLLITTSAIPILILFTSTIYDGMNSFNGEATFNISSTTLLNYLLTILVFSTMSISIKSYVKIYVEDNGIVELNKVYAYIKSNILQYLVMGLLIFLLAIVGWFLCLIPGIYLSVTFVVTGSLYVFQGRGIFDSIGDSFSFVKENWWDTFGIVLVIFILLVVTSGVFAAPNLIYTMGKTFTAIEDGDITKVSSLFGDPLYIVLAFISSMGQYFLQAIAMISYTLVYFDINEQKNASGSIDMIDNLGS